MSELICPPATLHHAKPLPSPIKSGPILYLPMAAISQSESFLLLSARGELIHSFIQCVNMHELQLLHCAVCHLLINSSWAGWVLGWFQACQGRREGGGGGLLVQLFLEPSPEPTYSREMCPCLPCCPTPHFSPCCPPSPLILPHLSSPLPLLPPIPLPSL